VRQHNIKQARTLMAMTRTLIRRYQRSEYHKVRTAEPPTSENRVANTKQADPMELKNDKQLFVGFRRYTNLRIASSRNWI
jgi:hypothetical protein